jgi:hypothetical protein
MDETSCLARQKVTKVEGKASTVRRFIGAPRCSDQTHETKTRNASRSDIQVDLGKEKITVKQGMVDGSSRMT